MSASGSRDPRIIMREAIRGIRNSESFAKWFRNAGIGTILLTIVFTISTGIQTATATILAPFRAVTNGIAEIISGTIGVSVGVIDAGGQAAITSFLSGWAQFFGPVAFPVAVAAVIAALAIFTQGWEEWVGFNPVDFLTNEED